MSEVGKVYLVGAGPGDPGLITLRGVECLRAADVVVYDRLANPALLEHARPDAERIYAGRAPDSQAPTQDQRNQLLIDLALQGKTVCRLKGGDPIVFGRGAEEAQALRARGIPYEIVPGVTAGIGAAAYAGIPLTLRGTSSSVAFVTGHEDPEKPEIFVNWELLAQSVDTLVVYMAVSRLQSITESLIEGGRCPDEPAAVVRWGTKSQQEVIQGVLGDIALQCTTMCMKPPALLIVGAVVNLRETLRWFDSRPLFGKQIVITRAAAQAGALDDLLSRRGAQVYSFPVIRIVEPQSWEPVDDAVSRLAEYQEYDWVIFTSANGVDHFVQRLQHHGFDGRAFGHSRLCAIGPATARRLSEHGLRADVLPEKFVAESVLEALAEESMEGSHVLLPRAATARDVLPDTLRSRGAQVDVVPVYRTVKAPADVEALLAELDADRIDAITFTASSTVRNFCHLLGEEIDRLRAGGVCIACIGPITAATAEEYGLVPDVIAETHTMEGLVQGLEDWFEEQWGGAGD